MKGRKILLRSGVGLGILLLLVMVFGVGFGTGILNLRTKFQTANRDTGRILAKNGIDEAGYLNLGGARQWITVRGHDRNAPILLFLHGGPGGALSDVAYSFQRPWEEEFVVVQWDQRGAGRSSIDGKALQGTLNLKNFNSDTEDLLEYLHRRFGRKIVVMGQSWGTILGATVAMRRPDLVAAFVSLGQVVAWELGFEETRRLLMALAIRTGNKNLREKMGDLGPMPLASADIEGHRKWMRIVQTEMNRYGYSWRNYQGPGASWAYRVLPALFGSPSISNKELMQQFLKIMTGNSDLPFDPSSEIYPTVSAWTVEKDVGTTFSVPVIMIMGRYDWQTPVTLARGYYKKICAPYKVWIELPESAHVVLAEEPGRLLRALTDKALPATRGRVPEGAEQCARASVRKGART